MTDQQAQEAMARLVDNPVYQAESAISYVISNLNEEIAWKERHPGARVHADFLRDMRRNVEEARDAYRTAIQQDDMVARLTAALRRADAWFEERAIDEADAEAVFVMQDVADALAEAEARSEQA